ncbi:MAG TPA: FkbM family methyltransferase [Gammaproteobacteria bacterium]|nr:FkbM family methyltransferase [Gammaproteobacteria bacterium]
MFFKLNKLTNIIKEPLFIRALFKGAAAGVEHRSVLIHLDDCNHVVDVGANRGQFALIARSCFSNARIDSFEPLIEPARIFEKVFADDSLTVLHQYAVGPDESEAIIHVSNRDDSSSLLPIGEGQVKLFPETAAKETRTVQVVPLKQVLAESEILFPALLKIDVQGYELSTLYGCSSLLHKFRYVYVECSFVELYMGQSLADEVIKFLFEHSFKLDGVYNIHYDKSGRAIQADLLFEVLDENTHLRN